MNVCRPPAIEEDWKGKKRSMSPRTTELHALTPNQEGTIVGLPFCGETEGRSRLVETDQGGGISQGGDATKRKSDADIENWLIRQKNALL